MRILKSLDLNRDLNFTGKFQNPEFKPMIKNSEETLHQGYLNNQKGAKMRKMLQNLL